MPSNLSREDVLGVAALARLELTDDEITLFTRQLADILGYAQEIQAIDTSDVPPMSHAGDAAILWREDEPTASLPREAALAHAPGAPRDAGVFRVPKVIG